MKYHFLLTSALTTFCLLTSTTSTAANSSKLAKKEQPRWFEIEVILFKHVSKKSENKEQFTARDLSAKKRRAFDLLTPYLQPNISSLKQLLPSCQLKKPELESKSKLPYEKLPYEMTTTPYNAWSENVDTQTSRALSINQSVQDVTLSEEKSGEELPTPAKMSVTVLPTSLNEPIEEAKIEQKVVLPNNQTHYATIKLPVYDQYPSTNQDALCVIPAEFFQQHLSSEQLEHFSIDGFPVAKLTRTISGLEQWQDDENGEITWASEQPYLISQDSLRLKSIANRIKRSRNYVPLLHLGWRQIGESRRKAQAMKLYAGENLDLGYQQVLVQQEAEQNAVKLQAILAQRQQAETLIANKMTLATEETSENLTLEPTSALAVETTNELSLEEQLRLQNKQQQLDKIFQQFALFDSQGNNSGNTNLNNTNESLFSEQDINRIVTELSADITVQEEQLSINSPSDSQLTITAPAQPWSIDGLFKVHLKRYLYIDTELNIIESANESSNENKVISFKQNRRVITGEIHYFDHPHIGMIVQIRRFDPTKPADEAVSQSKK